MPSHPEADAVNELIEELLRTGPALLDLLGSLLEGAPPNAFPGEDTGEVLIEMVAGTCRPALTAAGEAECRAATLLIRTIWESVMTDLRAAVALREPQGRDC